MKRLYPLEILREALYANAILSFGMITLYFSFVVIYCIFLNNVI